VSVLTLALMGDVMTGRGVDQVLPHPVAPDLYEAWVRDARDYVALAEARNGPILYPVAPDYIWGEALDEFALFQPAQRLINLETSITRHPEPWPGKGINYRMHPDNTVCLTAAGINACALANNHIMDWGVAGLEESCATLKQLGIPYAGAGANQEAASRPVVKPLPEGGRLLIWSIAFADSGVPLEWAADVDRPGVWLAPPDAAVDLPERIAREKRPGDLVVVSVHWGSNWGYRVPARHRIFGRCLIEAGANLVHGHSSHHPRGFELYGGAALLYGCGDFINDYEGIRGHEQYRPDLALLYFCTFDLNSGRLSAFWMTPLERVRLRLRRARAEDTKWLQALLNGERGDDSPEVRLGRDGRLYWIGPESGSRSSHTQPGR